MKISFIGGGVMAEALIAGILEARLCTPNQIRVGEPLKSRRTYLENKYAITVCQSNLSAIDDTNIIILSIKPQTLNEILSELKGHLTRDKTIISIIPGVSLATLSQALNHNEIIRVMPNTPAQIGDGMSVWVSSEFITDRRIKDTQKILDTLGEQLRVPEEKFIDMATALSGSGPAYVFLFIESLVDAGVNLGMPRNMALKLVLQTVLGSTKLVLTSDKHTSDLKDLVASPGGTTIAALMTLEQNGFRSAIADAVVTAYKKSLELGKG